MKKLLLLLLFCFTFSAAPVRSQIQPPPRLPGTEKKDAAVIYEQSLPAIVLIRTASESMSGFGSGVILRSDGVIATNYHVIEGATSASVKLQNGDIYDDVSIIETDERKDIAIIKIKAVNLPYLKTSNSDTVKIGSTVYVISAPRGLEGTLSSGIISSIRAAEEVDKSLSGFRMIQFTAATSPGSSGGPLLNEYGEVIGIHALSRVDGVDLRFGIPINYVFPLASTTKTEGRRLGKMSDVKIVERAVAKGTIEDLAGVYSGAWSSNDYNASGNVVLTLKVINGGVDARAVFTGSAFLREDALEVALTDLGAGIWRMDYKGKKSKIKGTGLFKNGQFVGDYKFKKLLWVDTGKWILNKS